MEPNEQHPGHGHAPHPHDKPAQDARATSDTVEISDEARAAALEAELASLREERLRDRADLDNQRRRLARDVENARRFANERVLSDLLPVIDNLERGLEAAGSDVDKLREGVELTLKQLRKVAEDNGLVAVSPEGAAFDPEQHQAMSMQASTDHAPGTVVQVFQKGYLLNDRLLRPALVVVAKDPDA